MHEDGREIEGARAEVAEKGRSLKISDLSALLL